MKIYLLRHGQTDFNAQHIVQGSGVDSDLNDKGREQAARFYEMYKNVPFDSLVTSKLKRTHQTSAHFIESGLPWHQNGDIDEISWGDQEGQKSTPESRALYRSITDKWRNGQYDFAFPNGESAQELGTRVQRFIYWMQTRPVETLLVCTHGRTMRCLITLMKGQPLSNMEDHVKHSNTGLFQAEMDKNGFFTFEKENCKAHLED